MSDNELRNFKIREITDPKVAIVGCILHARGCAFVTAFGLDDAYVDSESGEAFFKFQGKVYKVNTTLVESD